MAKFFPVDEFRAIIRKWITDNGMTVPQAARAMQVSSRTLYYFLDGRDVTTDTLSRMAQYLNGGAGVFLP